MDTTSLHSDAGGHSPRSLVRRFTQDVIANPGDDLALSLRAAEAEEAQRESSKASLVIDWQDLFETKRSDIDGLSENRQRVETAARELAQVWLRFQDCVPDGHKSSAASRPPRFEDVRNAVTLANEKWKSSREKSKTGRIRERFSRLCGTLDDYKFLFDVIPTSDKYVCVFTGSLSAIVKATANHDKIAESIESVLEHLSEDIPFWKKQMASHRYNVSMEYYITRLYVTIFRLLCDIMNKWYKSRKDRILHSFNSNFLEKTIKETREEIKRLSERLDKEANHVTQNQISDLPNRAYVDRKLTDLERRVGDYMKRLLENQCAQQQRAFSEAVAQLNLQPLQYSAGATWPQAPRMIDLEYPANEGIERLMSQLATYSKPQDQRVNGFIDKSIDMHIDDEVLQRIQRWFKEPKSKTLWIWGPFPVPTPSRNTLISAFITRMTREAGIPTLAYFCRRQRESHGDPIEETGEQELKILVYNLIVQMLHALHESPNADLPRINDQGWRLDGSVASLDEAVSFLETLLGMGPGLTFCIIDGLEELAYRVGENETLKDLLEVLCCKGMRGVQSTSDQVVKTLFTTDGNTRALFGLGPSERLDLSNVRGQNAAEVAPGYKSMKFLML